MIQKIHTIDALDALKMSIQSSMDLKDYYNDAAALVKNDDAEAILIGLADKKERHRQALIKIYSKTCGKKILYLNLGRKHKLNTLQKCSQDPNDAVRTAKKNEKELRTFFSTVARRLVDAELRNYFRHLAIEQDKDLTLLESSFEEPLMLDQDELEDKSVLNEIAY
ncbi:hypothetical protein JW935_06495 [candidate division KSB1 bacterium]|nr:hypothetical protein [candidate division KSB1 bacterium]